MSSPAWRVLAPLVVPIALGAALLGSCHPRRVEPAPAAAQLSSPDAAVEDSAALISRAMMLSSAGLAEQAIEPARRALEFQRRENGPTSAGYAGTLSLLGGLYISVGRTDEAKRAHLEALAIREAQDRPRPQDIAESLNALCNLEHVTGHDDEARAYCERAIAALGRVTGLERFHLGQVFNTLAGVEIALGNDAAAEGHYRASLENNRATLGQYAPNNFFVAQPHTGLGDLYLRAGRYRDAEREFRAAIQILEGAPGLGEMELVKNLRHLAWVYDAEERFQDSEPLYRRGLDLRRRGLFPDPVLEGAALDWLALNQQSQGAYDRAEEMYRKAVRLLEHAGPGSEQDLGAALLHLGSLYEDEGRWEEAQPIYARVVRDFAGKKGLMAPIAVSGWLALTSLQQRLGFDPRGGLVDDKALAAMQEAAAKFAPKIAPLVASLRAIAPRPGEAPAAATMARLTTAIDQALVAASASFGARRPPNLFDLFREWERYDPSGRIGERIVSELTRALAAPPTREPRDGGAPITLGDLARMTPSARSPADRRRIKAARDKLSHMLGPSHPDLAIVDLVLAETWLRARRLDKALPLLQQALVLDESRLRMASRAFVEGRIAAVLERMAEWGRVYYSLPLAFPQNPRALRIALSAALLRKGRSQGELVATSQAIQRGLPPEDRERYRQLRQLQTRRERLVDLGSSAPAGGERGAWLRLGEQAEEIESDLARRSAPLRAARSQPGPDDVVDRVADRLPPDGALLEIVAFRPAPLSSAGAKHDAAARYEAFVLLSDRSIHFADLGPAAAIDDAVRALRETLTEDRRPWRDASRRLRQLVLAPLDRVLADRRTLLVAPDGQLNLVSFAILDDGARPTLDTLRISYLTSGRDLLRDASPASSSRAVMIFAAPDFAASVPDAPPIASSPLAMRSGPSFERGRQYLPLPGTEAEARAIQALWPQARLLLGAAATKDALLAQEAPAVLHVATHGEFLDDATGAAPPSARGTVVVGELAPEVKPPRNPLLRSALVFAGASAPTAPGRAPDPLRAKATALEIAGMDLWGTQLVVLSACETGIGEAHDGQGVYGLRRAVIAAGAEALVVSLWRVDDASTQAMMTAFYSALAAGRPRADALTEAMRGMREHAPHPFDWGGFILVGDRRPLRL